MFFDIQINKEKLKIETHERPHLDELLAIWLIENFATEEFIRKYATDKRIIEIGTGGGWFDEHSSLNSVRKSGESSATLVAKALQVTENPILQPILDFVTQHDLKGGRQIFDLDWAVQLLNTEVQDFQVVYDWLTIVLDSYYSQQKQFLSRTREEYSKVAQVETVAGPNGKLYKMVTVVSDNEQMNKFARREGAAIVIQQNSKGNIQIFTNQKYGLKLFDIVQIIRVEEQKKKGRLITTDWRLLAEEGTVLGAEEWYFHVQGQMLLNGSLSHPEIPATKLSLGEIKKFIRIGLNPNTYEAAHFHDCKRSICTNFQNKCPWYPYGLSRCRKIRFTMKVQSQSQSNPDKSNPHFNTSKKKKPIIIKF